MAIVSWDDHLNEISKSGISRTWVGYQGKRGRRARITHCDELRGIKVDYNVGKVGKKLKIQGFSDKVHFLLEQDNSHVTIIDSCDILRLKINFPQLQGNFWHTGILYLVLVVFNSIHRQKSI